MLCGRLRERGAAGHTPKGGRTSAENRPIAGEVYKNGTTSRLQAVLNLLTTQYTADERREVLDVLRLQAGGEGGGK